MQGSAKGYRDRTEIFLDGCRCTPKKTTVKIICGTVEIYTREKQICASNYFCVPIVVVTKCGPSELFENGFFKVWGVCEWL